MLSAESMETSPDGEIILRQRGTPVLKPRVKTS